MGWNHLQPQWFGDWMRPHIKDKMVWHSDSRCILRIRSNILYQTIVVCNKQPDFHKHAHSIIPSSCTRTSVEMQQKLSTGTQLSKLRPEFVVPMHHRLDRSPLIASRGIPSRRIASRWRIASTLRRIIWLPIRRRISWLATVCRRRISNSRGVWLIEARHLLHSWHCHRGLWAKLTISLVHFNLVLCLHTSAHRAIYQIRQARKNLRSLWNFITSNNHSNNRKNASNLLETEHETDNAIITLRCLYVEFILQHEPRRSYRICKA